MKNTMARMNAYKLYIKQIYGQRIRRGENPDIRSMYMELGNAWENEPEYVKTRLKERAKQINDQQRTRQQQDSIMNTQNSNHNNDFNYYNRGNIRLDIDAYNLYLKERRDHYECYEFGRNYDIMNISRSVWSELPDLIKEIYYDRVRKQL